MIKALKELYDVCSTAEQSIFADTINLLLQGKSEEEILDGLLEKGKNKMSHIYQIKVQRTLRYEETMYIKSNEPITTIGSAISRQIAEAADVITPTRWRQITSSPADTTPTLIRECAEQDAPQIDLLVRKPVTIIRS